MAVRMSGLRVGGMRLARLMSGGPSKEAVAALEKAEAVMRTHQAAMLETKVGEAFFHDQYYACKAITTPAVENWMVFRENMEKTFQWTPGNIVTAITFCLVVPYYAYRAIAGEIERRPAHLPFGVTADNPLKGPIEKIVEGKLRRDRERELAGLPPIPQK